MLVVAIFSCVDGLCVAASELSALAEAGLVERAPPEASRVARGGPPDGQDAFVREALRLAAQTAEAEAATRAVRDDVEGLLEWRAVQLNRRKTYYIADRLHIGAYFGPVFWAISFVCVAYREAHRRTKNT